MTIDETGSESERLARELLEPTLASRDREALFDRSAFRLLMRSGIGEAATRAEPGFTRKLLRLFYGVGRGSMDVPFGTSLVAQTIAISVVRDFARRDGDRSLPERLSQGEALAALANSEIDAGTNAKGAQSQVVRAPGGGWELTGRKPCFTNGPADVLLFSAWVDGSPPAMESLLLSGDAVPQKDVSAELSGFRTGRTGACAADRVPVDVERCRMGPPKSGFEVMKFSFDLERLLIPAVVAGALDGALRLAVDTMKRRARGSLPIHEKQWAQDKAIALFAAKESILASISLLLERGCEAKFGSMRAHDASLARAKWEAVERGHAAAVAWMELCGHVGVKTDAPAQKLVRDLAMLKLLGGTSELQKSFVFSSFFSEPEATHGRRKSA